MKRDRQAPATPGRQRSRPTDVLASRRHALAPERMIRAFRPAGLLERAAVPEGRETDDSSARQGSARGWWKAWCVRIALQRYRSRAHTGAASACRTVVRWLAPACMVLALAACATNTIKPSYETSNPDIQIGGPRPDDGPAQIENAGSFCLETTEKWHRDGKTDPSVPAPVQPRIGRARAWYRSDRLRPVRRS